MEIACQGCRIPAGYARPGLSRKQECGRASPSCTGASSGCKGRRSCWKLPGKAGWRKQQSFATWKCWARRSWKTSLEEEITARACTDSECGCCASKFSWRERQSCATSSSLAARKARCQEILPRTHAASRDRWRYAKLEEIIARRAQSDGAHKRSQCGSGAGKLRRGGRGCRKTCSRRAGRYSGRQKSERTLETTISCTARGTFSTEPRGSGIKCGTGKPQCRHWRCLTKSSQ
mmetsp:Transcript_114225/g.213939  ORF Transcript_114225/g.213939 Transcript_114225/m.213939 type:complete len:233 (+) Transcript_114225:180-878(+)